MTEWIDRVHQDFHSVVCVQGGDSAVSEIHVLSMDLYFVAYCVSNPS